MKLPHLGDIPEFIPIPKLMHSFLYEGMFANCSMCDRYLLDDDTNYMIEKAFKGDEVIFEYAICNDCRVKVGEDLSQKSMILIEHYIDERVDLLERRQSLIKEYNQTIDPWINECVFTGRSRIDCDRYQICVECDGTDLIFTYLPFMISSAAIDEIQNLLSKKTRDKMDGFIREIVSPPFEILDIPLLF